MDILVIDDKKENLINGMQKCTDLIGIEDNPQNFNGVYFATSENHSVDGATNTTDAQKMLDSVEHNVVVCDVQMPCHSHDGRQMTSKDTPGGVSIALEALSEGIPVVFCSSEYHHGDALEWLYRSYHYLEEMSGVPVELVTETNDSGGKRWSQAFELALEIAESER